jgi:ribosomal-protein-alanine N-acetyltransferase
VESPNFRPSGPEIIFVSEDESQKIEKVHYRPYLPDDFAALYALETRCFQLPQRFTRRYMRQLVTSPNAATWIAVDEAEKLAGFAIVEWVNLPSETVAYIETLEVSAEQRRKGVGAGLLHHAVATAREADATALWLHVAEENQAARGLYAAQGFVMLGREKNYYGRGRHALVLALSLASPTGLRAE